VPGVSGSDHEHECDRIRGACCAHYHDGITSHFRHLKSHLNDNPDCHLEIGYREDLAHLIYAGADLLIAPSMFEPCGLAPLIATADYSWTRPAQEYLDIYQHIRHK
jgi:glycogen synthase